MYVCMHACMHVCMYVCMYVMRMGYRWECSYGTVNHLPPNMAQVATREKGRTACMDIGKDEHGGLWTTTLRTTTVRHN